MSDGYQITNQSAVYFLTFTVVDWMDVFSRKAYRDILIESFKFCREQKGLKIWGYVIMTNHVHCILSASNNNLSNVIRDWKHYTATHIIKAIQDPSESRSDWLLKR